MTSRADWVYKIDPIFRRDHVTAPHVDGILPSYNPRMVLETS